MKKHDKLDLIIASDGMLLTQASDVEIEKRIFSSRVYTGNENDWEEWSLSKVDEFIKERDKFTEETTEIPELEETL